MPFQQLPSTQIHPNTAAFLKTDLFTHISLKVTLTKVISPFWEVLDVYLFSAFNSQDTKVSFCFSSKHHIV